VLVGDEGVLVVDSSYAPLTSKLVAAIRKLSPAPIRFLVNTHEHPDHTSGNANLVHGGALLIGREELRVALTDMTPAVTGTNAIGADRARSLGSDPARLPTITYGQSPIKIYLDGEIVDLIPLPPGHTNTDSLVRFERADVIMCGDFYRNYGYPYIDDLHGGTIKGTIAELDLLSNLAGPGTIIAPGHGTIVNRRNLAAYREMILDVESKVRQLIKAGKDERGVLAANITANYDASIPGALDPAPDAGGSNADRFVKAVYKEMVSEK
jgi:glyoxylase-like metal-dependent hydrolase (beta-lactamase superfamily II)